MAIPAHPTLAITVEELARKHEKEPDDPTLYSEIKERVLSQFTPNSFLCKPTSHSISGDHLAYRNNGRMHAILHPGQPQPQWQFPMDAGCVKSNGLQALMPATPMDEGEEVMDEGRVVVKAPSGPLDLPAPSPTFPAADEEEEEAESGGDEDMDSDDDDDDDDDVVEDEDDASDLKDFVVSDDSDDDGEMGSDGEFSPAEDSDDDVASDDDSDDSDDESDDDDKPLAPSSKLSFRKLAVPIATEDADGSESSDSDMTPPPPPVPARQKKAAAAKPAAKRSTPTAPPPMPSGCKDAFVRFATCSTDGSDPEHLATFNKYIGPQRESLALAREIMKATSAHPKLCSAIGEVMAGGGGVAVTSANKGYKECQLTGATPRELVKVSMFKDGEWVDVHTTETVGNLLQGLDATVYATTRLAEGVQDSDLPQLGLCVARLYWAWMCWLRVYLTEKTR